MIERTPNQVPEVVASEKRAHDLDIPHRGDVANGLAVAGGNVVLRIVEVEKPAGALVDHAFVPREHEFEPINECPDALRIVISRVPISPVCVEQAHGTTHVSGPSRAERREDGDIGVE